MTPVRRPEGGPGNRRWSRSPTGATSYTPRPDEGRNTKGVAVRARCILGPRPDLVGRNGAGSERGDGAPGALPRCSADRSGHLWPQPHPAAVGAATGCAGWGRSDGFDGMDERLSGCARVAAAEASFRRTGIVAGGPASPVSASRLGGFGAPAGRFLGRAGRLQDSFAGIRRGVDGGGGGAWDLAGRGRPGPDVAVVGEALLLLGEPRAAHLAVVVGSQQH